jgi:putative flippase GtrA
MSISLPLPTPRTVVRLPRSNAATQGISRRRPGRISARLRTGFGPRRAGVTAGPLGTPARGTRRLGTALERLGTAPEQLRTAPEQLRTAPEQLRTAPEQLRTAPGRLGAAPRRLWNTQLIGQLTRFSAIGVISTVVQLGLFLLLRNEVGALTANLISLVLSTVANTEANRRITFGIRGRDGAVRHQLQGLAVFGLSLALSSGALTLLGLVAPTAGASAELIVLIAANALPVVARFALLRTWVFGTRPSA